MLPTQNRYARSVIPARPDYSWPDGKRLACGSMDGGVALFDVASGKFLASLPGHHRPVRSVAFSADSTKVLTGCDDMH